MEFKIRKDDGEIPALGSLVRVRLAIALLRQWLSERTPAGVSQDWRFECGAGEHPAAYLHHGALWNQITRGPRCHGWGRVPLVLRGDGPLMSKANPPSATERGSLWSTDKRRVTVLPKQGFRRHKDVRARCTRGTDDPGTSSLLVRMGGLTLQSERESLHG